MDPESQNQNIFSKAIKLVFKDKGKNDKENPFEHPDNKY